LGKAEFLRRDPKCQSSKFEDSRSRRQRPCSLDLKTGESLPSPFAGFPSTVHPGRTGGCDPSGCSG
jgi:hypothetical protein